MSKNPYTLSWRSLRLSHCLTAIAIVAVLSASHANAVVIQEWDASDWSGSGDWTASTSSEVLTIAAGAPTQGVGVQSGQYITYVSFDGDDGFVSDDSPLTAGLQEFTISAVIRVGADPGAGAGGDGQGWLYKDITGFELGGGNQGEFQFGFANEGGSPNTLNGAVGLGGDQFTKGGIVPADTWATVAFVVDQLDGDPTMYSLSTYINGVSQGDSGPFAYGADPGDDIRDGAAGRFGVGYNVIGGGDLRYLTGDIAQLRFDDTALSASEIAADSANFLGTLEGAVPEPTSFLLAGLGCLGLGLARKRKQG